MPAQEQMQSPPDRGLLLPGPSPPPPVEVTLPFWKNLVAGGGAGLLEIACMYPTDVSVMCVMLRVDVILCVRPFMKHLMRRCCCCCCCCCCCFCRCCCCLLRYAFSRTAVSRRPLDPLASLSLAL